MYLSNAVLNPHPSLRTPCLRVHWTGSRGGAKARRHGAPFSQGLDLLDRNTSPEAVASRDTADRDNGQYI
jgi:hypothetical protein